MKHSASLAAILAVCAASTVLAGPVRAADDTKAPAVSAKPDIAVLTKRAEGGDVAAERDLGLAYRDGKGVEEDDGKAFQ